MSVYVSGLGLDFAESVVDFEPEQKSLGRVHHGLAHHGLGQTRFGLEHLAHLEVYLAHPEVDLAHAEVDLVYPEVDLGIGLEHVEVGPANLDDSHLEIGPDHSHFVHYLVQLEVDLDVGSVLLCVGLVYLGVGLVHLDVGLLQFGTGLVLLGVDFGNFDQT